MNSSDEQLLGIFKIKKDGQSIYINQFCRPNGEENTSKESASGKVELTQEV